MVFTRTYTNTVIMTEILYISILTILKPFPKATPLEIIPEGLFLCVGSITIVTEKPEKGALLILYTLKEMPSGPAFGRRGLKYVRNIC